MRLHPKLAFWEMLFELLTRAAQKFSRWVRRGRRP